LRKANGKCKQSFFGCHDLLTLLPAKIKKDNETHSTSAKSYSFLLEQNDIMSQPASCKNQKHALGFKTLRKN
jgi:hypothetical protein